MLDGAALATMRPGAILINTARGPIADEDALLDALNRGHLYAAGLDVYSDEPPQANREPLITHPHVVATGHYAWYSTPAHQELQRRAAENMLAMLRGEIPEDCLNAGAFQ
jgi:phosphoglycerate dehydrogenase-like enzyme